MAQGTNPFAALKSKLFDLQLDLDLTTTTATSVTVKLADLTFALDLAGQKLFGATVTPIANHVKLRILRDWGQYEIFANDGQVVHTDVHAFMPSDSSFSVTGDGSVGLASADLHQLGRAWPGTAATSSVIIDDSDVGTTYTWRLEPSQRRPLLQGQRALQHHRPVLRGAVHRHMRRMVRPQKYRPWQS